MTREQIDMVQKSYRQLQSHGQAASDLFYSRLFQINPELWAFFPEDTREARSLFMSMLGFAVSTLERFDVFVPAFEELGRRHAGYGVRSEHYGPAAEALLFAIGETLDKEASLQKTLLAWHEMYWTIAGVMIDAGCRHARSKSVAAVSCGLGENAVSYVPSSKTGVRLISI